MSQAIAPYFVRILLGETLQNTFRSARELVRMGTFSEHNVYAYLQLDDAHSYLLAQSLKEFTRRYKSKLHIRVVPPPAPWAAQEAEKLDVHNRRDCADIAPFYGLQFNDPGKQPSQTQLDLAIRIAVAAAKADNEQALDGFLDAAKALWAGDENTLKSKAPSEVTDADALKVLDDNAKERDSTGHYLSGMLYYQGEWYWGIDRLYFLEDRLQDLGILKDASHKGSHILNLKGNKTLDKVTKTSVKKKPKVAVFYSIRSPYSYLAMPDIQRWEKDDRINFNFHLVKPMVLRGLPVPDVKRMYIARDTARRARSIGIPFGFICDPIRGGGVQNGLKVYPYARSQGKGSDFIWLFNKRSWSEGIDMGKDSNILQIAKDIGLDTDKVAELLKGDHSEADELTERNRQILFNELNLWGVPSFQVNDWHTWGQDRDWLVEHKICEAIEQA
eukprot:Clim_evm14s12 gene=Clim_evmTU14s12